MVVTGVSSAALGQDWPFNFFKPDGPALGAPTSPASWNVTVQRATPEKVRGFDPTWKATVAFAKVPLLVANPIPRAPPRPDNPLTGKPHVLEGLASYYWQEQTTSTGEPFDKLAMTAAHRTLPLNSRVRVTNVLNGRSVVVRINDRGPYTPGRIIDLSEAAAGMLDMHTLGLVPVTLKVISN